MDKRKFLLQIIRGQEPKRRYIKLYEYQGDKRVFLGQQEISLSGKSTQSSPLNSQ